MKHKHLNLINSGKGFSLVESMVTLTIFLFLCVSLYTSMAVGEQAWEVNKTKIELQQELRKAIQHMKYALMQTGNDAVFNLSGGSTNDQIRFKISDGIQGSSIKWTDDTYVFQRGGTGGNDLQKVIQRVTGNITQTLAQDITSLTFSRTVQDPSIIHIDLQAQKNTPKGRTITMQADCEVGMRN